MIKITNIYKKFKYPINELDIISKILFKKKKSSKIALNEFYGLENLNLTINSGDKVFVLGKSASGKSTLFSVLSNIIDSDYGKIEMSNSIFSSSFRAIPQNLIPRLSLKNFIRFLICFYCKDLSLKLINDYENEIRDFLKIDKKRAKNYWYEFSSNLQFIIILYLAIKSNDKIFLMDNFSFLKEEKNLTLAKKLFEEKKDKTIIIFDCFDLDFIEKYANKILILNDGKVFKYLDFDKINKSQLEELVISHKSVNEYLDIDANE